MTRKHPIKLATKGYAYDRPTTLYSPDRILGPPPPNGEPGGTLPLPPKTAPPDDPPGAGLGGAAGPAASSPPAAATRVRASVRKPARCRSGEFSEPARSRARFPSAR